MFVIVDVERFTVQMGSMIAQDGGANAKLARSLLQVEKKKTGTPMLHSETPN